MADETEGTGPEAIQDAPASTPQADGDDGTIPPAPEAEASGEGEANSDR